MTGTSEQVMIEQYLRRVDESLAGVSDWQRREILDDLRSHIAEALEAEPDRSEASVRRVLDRLGSPDELARETRERLGVEPVPARQGPGLLEVAAIALTAFMFPVGILLAWISPRWRTRDKLIATVIPFIGLLFLVGAMIPAYTAPTVEHGPSSDVQVDGVNGLPRPVPEPVEPTFEPSSKGFVSKILDSVGKVMPRLFVLGMLSLSLLSPFVSAFYLAIRLDRLPEHRRSRDAMTPIAA